jgi:hypothetical protein
MVAASGGSPGRPPLEVGRLVAVRRPALLAAPKLPPPRAAPPPLLPPPPPPLVLRMRLCRPAAATDSVMESTKDSSGAKL